MRRLWSLLRLVCVPVALLALPGVARAETALFKVAVRTQFPLPPSDSYVLPLTNPTDIGTARALVNGGGSLIVNARIEAGADAINRDFNAPGTPEWSWHVAEFLGFSSSAIELCDGTPTQVEQDVAGWINNTGGSICFWAYTVVAELPPIVSLDSSSWGRVKALYRD